jgi:DNA mismatch endonuclease (patch repair protein)
MNQIKMKIHKPTKRVSERMKLVKAKGTIIEKRMQSILRKLKIRHTRHPKMFGHPDFLLKETQILIFCDSSFWHGRHVKDLSGESFRRNREFWRRKINDNKRRDSRNNRILRKKGYSVQRFWDTDIMGNKDKVIRKLKRALR